MGLNTKTENKVVQVKKLATPLIKAGGYAEPICFPDCNPVIKVANMK